MTSKSPPVVPAWQRIVGVVAALGLIYLLYRGGDGGIAATIIPIFMLFCVRSLYKSGAMAATTAFPKSSALKSRFFIRDALLGVGTWILAFLWVIAGTILVKRNILADNNLTAGLIVVPSMVLILAGSFFAWRILNGFIFGRRE